tara:strand:- start:778 stop:1374 length:597 start_codon:yes stop_codon:yes gene_type:complete
MTTEDDWSTTEYITLANEYREVFRNPAVIDMVCNHTNQRIRRVKPRSKNPNQNKVWKAYLQMIGSHRLDLHPPQNTKATSIQAMISMSRVIADMAQKEIETVLGALKSGRTIVSNRETINGDDGRPRVVIHPDAEMKHSYGGNILLRAKINPWNKIIEQVDETIEELLRIKKDFEDGFCDGDTKLDHCRTGAGNHGPE